VAACYLASGLGLAADARHPKNDQPCGLRLLQDGREDEGERTLRGSSSGGWAAWNSNWKDELCGS